MSKQTRYRHRLTPAAASPVYATIRQRDYRDVHAMMVSLPDTPRMLIVSAYFIEHLKQFGRPPADCPATFTGMPVQVSSLLPVSEKCTRRHLRRMEWVKRHAKPPEPPKRDTWPSVWSDDTWPSVWSDDTWQDTRQPQMRRLIP